MKLMTDADVEWLLSLGRRFHAIIWITYTHDGYTQPLLMPWPQWWDA